MEVKGSFLLSTHTIPLSTLSDPQFNSNCKSHVFLIHSSCENTANLSLQPQID